jgi:hypothetical protein
VRGPVLCHCQTHCVILLVETRIFFHPLLHDYTPKKLTIDNTSFY